MLCVLRRLFLIKVCSGC